MRRLAYTPQLIGSLLAWLYLLFAANAIAQGQPAEEPAARTPAINTIAPAYIPEQADQDERFARQVVERSTRFDADGAHARRLTQIHDDVLALANAYQPGQLGELTAPRLKSLEKYWHLHDKRLDRWQETLQALTARYSADTGELARRRALWEATLESSTADAVAPALVQRVNQILERLQSAQGAISAPLDDAIKLGRRGNQVRGDLDMGAKAVARAIDTYTRRLWMIDMPPLWQLPGPQLGSFRQFAGGGETGVNIEQSFLRQYLSEESRELATFGLVWLVSLPLFLWFGWHERQRRRSDSGAEAAAPVLRRPLSGWLLLGALALPLVFADAPVGLQQAALLLSLVPVIRLLPGEVFKLLRWLPYAIVALYFAHRIRVFFWDDPLYYRVHLLFITMLSAGMVTWLLRFSAHRPSILQGRKRMLLRGLGWLAVAALVSSAVANVVGNVSLAEMLTIGVVESAYVALAIYAGVSALLAIGYLLLAAPASAQTGFIARNVTPLRSGLGTLIRVGALVLWIVVTIDKFQIYRPTAEWLIAVLTKPLSLGKLEVTLGGVLLFLLSVWLALWIARTARVLLQNEVLSGMKLPPGVANSVSSLTYYVLVFVGLLAALAAAGFEISNLTLVIGALGVGIGLGLQNVVGNFVSGLILMFERPIRPGDVVEVASTIGRVREIGMRATTLQTFEGADVVVPNGTLLSENLINWTLSNTNRRVDLDIGVSYAADPPTVQTLLAQVAAAIPGISASPAPAVLFLRFNASSLDFGIRAWTNDFDNWAAIRSALGIAVFAALKRADIEIPYPQQDLHLRSVDEGAKSEVAKLNRGGDEEPA